MNEERGMELWQDQRRMQCMAGSKKKGIKFIAESQKRGIEFMAGSKNRYNSWEKRDSINGRIKKKREKKGGEREGDEIYDRIRKKEFNL